MAFRPAYRGGPGERRGQAAPALLAAVPLLLACGSSAPESRSQLLDVERALEGAPRFERPVWFGVVPGAEGWHAVAEQAGRVHALRLDAGGAVVESAVLLDITGRTSRAQNEEGLIGLAFHPDFAENRRLFVHYSVRREQRGRVSELRVGAEGPPVADAESERVLLEVPQPWGNHNGGHLEFGPDGMLYVGLGDGGAAGDPKGAGQDLSTLLGSILRIDVDAPRGDAPYVVPSDNPFVDTEGARGEIWALGLRNPWRFAFDSETGALWVGDVGQVEREEIDVVVRGGNYGWKVREGTLPYAPDAERGPGELLEPVLDYPRSDGWSVTGGRVVRGGPVPGLDGRYVYADYVSDAVWAVRADPDDPGEPDRIATLPRPTSFGVDAAGRLHVTCFDGHVYRFVERAPTDGDSGADD
jgi:glucose/arabinose dehydrogenase